jgi:type II secretory pathway component PulJ
MISMSIFAVMSVIIMSVYIQTTNTARKMNATRELSETAREITERIAQDLRDRGISLIGSVIDDNISPDSWSTSNYTQS